jgi:ABC-type protease/lipase transport system fused ATPase/permease subunit
MKQERKRSPLELAMGACRGGFLAVGGFSLVINLLMLASPIYIMQVFDRVLPSRSTETLLLLTLLVAGAFAVLAVLDVIRSVMMVRLSTWLDRMLGSVLLRASLDAALQGRGRTVEPLRDLVTLRGFLTTAGATALFDSPWVLIFLGVIFLLHPILGFVALGGAIALFVLAIANEYLMRKPLAAAGPAALAGFRKAEATVRNAEVTEAMGMFPGLVRAWDADNVRSLGEQGAAMERGNVITGLVKFIRLMMQIGIYGVGALLVIDDSITPGVMFAASLLTGRALAPVETAVSTWRGLAAAREAYGRLAELTRRATPRSARLTAGLPS